LNPEPRTPLLGRVWFSLLPFQFRCGAQYFSFFPSSRRFQPATSFSQTFGAGESLYVAPYTSAPFYLGIRGTGLLLDRFHIGIPVSSWLSVLSADALPPKRSKPAPLLRFTDLKILPPPWAGVVQIGYLTRPNPPRTPVIPTTITSDGLTLSKVTEVQRARSCPNVTAIVPSNPPFFYFSTGRQDFS